MLTQADAFHIPIDLSRPYLDEQARIRVGMSSNGRDTEGLPLFEEAQNEQ